MVQENTSGRATFTRRALGCAALFGVAGPLLVACGDDETAGAGTGTGAGAAEPDSTGSSAPESGDSLVAAADVPVGGGVVLPEHELVVTQPAEGEFKAFTTVCTHQGTRLSAVSQGLITCPAHGSQFAVEDGANVTGPNGSEGGSVADLEEFEVEVVDGQVVLV